MRAMMLVLSLVLGVVPLLGVVWIVTSGMITLWPPSATVDGLLISLIQLSLSGCFIFNSYWELRDRGLLHLGAKQAGVPAKAPAPKAS
jgi:hypothetical protein